MSYKYIAIEREYGSGGTKIAHQLAEEYGIACYGQEILEAVSKRLQVPTGQIEKYEENVTTSFMYTLHMITRTQDGNPDMLTKDGHIFVAEQQEIKHLAASGPAIFIGHCAAEALKECKVLKVFIRCSDEEAKNKRIEEDYGIIPEKIGSTRKYFDNKRSRYYYANTAKKWEDLKNYDIVLDSGELGIDGCVAVLAALLENKKM